MKKIGMRQIQRSAWLRALRVPSAAGGMPEDVENTLEVQMSRAEEMLMSAAEPKVVYRVMERADISTEGYAIEKHLTGCQRVIIMAATLGTAVDTLLRKTQITDMALAVILDAGASVMIEQICDDFEEMIKGQLSQQETNGVSRQLYFTDRFSPGYGDYPITEQGRILRYLDTATRIGLYITPDSLMIPRKSVTALIGMAHQPVTGRLAGCIGCILREECTLRKEGKFCGDKF